MNQTSWIQGESVNLPKDSESKTTSNNNFGYTNNNQYMQSSYETSNDTNNIMAFPPNQPTPSDASYRAGRNIISHPSPEVFNNDVTNISI